MISLPLNTTVAFTAATGKGTQDQSFLPYTINPDVSTAPLPMGNLNGDVAVTRLDLTLTSRPMDKLRLRAGFKHDERNDKTDPLSVSYVTTDTGTGTTTTYGDKVAWIGMIIVDENYRRHGIGRADIVENRLVGMKSRGVYETPAGTIIRRAHQALESICLDKYTMRYKDFIAVKYAELVYNGLWFCQLREALDAFVATTQRNVTGTVRLKLYKGNVIMAGRKSPLSLYREDYASFGEEDVYNQKDAHGFIQLFGLPLKVEALLAIDGGGESRYRKPDYDRFKRD